MEGIFLPNSGCIQMLYLGFSCNCTHIQNRSIVLANVVDHTSWLDPNRPSVVGPGIIPIMHGVPPGMTLLPQHPGAPPVLVPIIRPGVTSSPGHAGEVGLSARSSGFQPMMNSTQQIHEPPNVSFNQASQLDLQARITTFIRLFCRRLCTLCCATPVPCLLKLQSGPNERNRVRHHINHRLPKHLPPNKVRRSLITMTNQDWRFSRSKKLS